MEKMNQVSVSEFFAKSKEEMYDDAVAMVEKYNRLVDICNDSAERMAELMAKDDINEFKKDIADKAAKIELMQKEIEGRKAGYWALKEKYDKLEKEVEELHKKDEDRKDHIKELESEYVHVTKYNKIVHSIDLRVEENKKLRKEIDGLREDVKYWKEAFETQATSLAEVRKCNDSLVDTLNKSSDRVDELEKQVKYLEKELNETCTTKELDLKGHNRREMALVNELADKNDEIKSLKEENSYLKSEIKQKQNIIKKAYERYSDDIIKTHKDLMEVAYRDIEKDNGYVGFKLYVKSALIEAKGDKNEANEIITDAVKFAYAEWDKTQKENEKTIKKAIKEVMNKKYGYAGEIAFRIRSEVDKKRIVDIGDGAEKILGVSRELFDAAIKALVDDGYQEIIGRIPKATNSYVYMDMHVLATPDVETKETANAENIKSLDSGIPCGEDAIE